MKKINILAVGDPATDVYVNEENRFLYQFTEQTGIEVQFDIVDFTNYYTTLMNSFQKYKYDVVMVAGHLWLREFAEKGFLKKLSDSFIRNFNYDDIVPSVLKEILLHDEPYLIPSFCDGHILIYRKSEIKEKLDEIVSIDQMIEVVKNNHVLQKDTFVLKSHPSEIFLDFLPYLRSEGTDAFDNEGNPLFNTASGYKALDKYIQMKDYCSKNVAHFGNKEVLESIQNNRCKLGVSWGGQIGQIMNDHCVNPEDIGYAALETSWNTTWCFGINHLCQNQNDVEEFLKFISSKEVDQAVGAYCGNPTRISSFKKGEDTYRWYPILLKMLQRAKPLPHLPNTSQLIGIITEDIVKAYNGLITSQEALKNAYHTIMQLREVF